MKFMVGKKPLSEQGGSERGKRESQPLFSNWRGEAVVLVLTDAQNGRQDRVRGVRLHGDDAIDVFLLLAAEVVIGEAVGGN